MAVAQVAENHGDEWGLSEAWPDTYDEGYMQALPFEVCNCTSMPWHTPK